MAKLLNQELSNFFYFNCICVVKKLLLLPQIYDCYIIVKLLIFIETK